MNEHKRWWFRHTVGYKLADRWDFSLFRPVSLVLGLSMMFTMLVPVFVLGLAVSAAPAISAPSLALAIPPRSRKLGTISFTRAAFGVDLYGPQGGLPLETYSGMILDLNGILTITGGANDGTPTMENPRNLIKALQVQVTGLTAGDSFIDIPLVDLTVLSHFIQTRPPVPPTETTVNSGAVGTYNFAGQYYLPFILPDMQNPFRGMFPSARSGQTKIRVLWGTEEDIVAGGDRTKAISNCQVDFWGADIFSGDPRFDALKGLLLHQRVNIKQIALGPNGTAQTDFDMEIQRTPAFLDKLVLRTFTTDANGVETPINTLIRATDPITLFLNEGERKFEYTGKMTNFKNRLHYMFPSGVQFPTGYYILDMAPTGEEGLLVNQMNYQTIKVRINNAAIANSNIRIVAVKFANLPF